MPSEFKENAEDLNTGDSVQVDVDEPMSADATQSLVNREVWLLNKCSLCGYFPLTQTERDGFGKLWHVHDVIAATAVAIAKHRE